MNEQDLVNELLNELSQNGLPRIGFAHIDEKDPDIVNVTCDFGLFNFLHLQTILHKIGYTYNMQDYKNPKNFMNHILHTVNNIIGYSS